MPRIKIDTETLKLMNFFESITGSKLRDCFVDSLGTLTFVVQDGIGLAIGKNGAMFRRVERELRRKVRIIPYSDDLARFVSNLLLPLKVRDIGFDESAKVLTITSEPDSRGYIIGRAAQNLRNYESIVKRYFDVKEIKVV